MLETSWTQESNKTMENTYNAEGKRVAKTVDGGQSVRYFYEYNDVVFEYVNGGAVTVFNVIGTNLISREIGSDKVYYFYNGHGDVTALLDATTKNIRSQYQYDSFGNITLENYYDSNGVLTTDPDEMIKSQIRYAGYQYDEESDYYNLHARYYDPKTARFLQQDTYTGTIGDPLSLNLYTYCLQNPIRYYDPTGYTGEEVFDLLSEIINQKEIYEKDQEWRDNLWGVDPRRHKRTKKQNDAAKEADKIRDQIFETDTYKNNDDFKKAYDKYYKKEHGGTKKDVRYLISLISLTQPRGSSYPIVPSNNIPTEGTGKVVKEYKTNYELEIMIETVYGEAASESEASWKAVANVIMNRVGNYEWRKYDTVEKVIKNSGFDAYTDPNEPYKTMVDYLNIRSDVSTKNDHLEEVINVVASVYYGDTEDNTNGAVLYYSPKAMIALYGKPMPPDWNFSILEEVIVKGAENDDFRFYKYK